MRLSTKRFCVAIMSAIAVCCAAFISAAEPDESDEPLPEVSTAQLIKALRASMTSYEVGRLEANFEEEQDANSFSADKNVKPSLFKWPGHFSYSSDGRRYRAEYQAKQINSSPRGAYLGPYQWSAGFDGNVHYLSDRQGWVIGEEHVSARTLRAVELFWPQASSLLDETPDPSLRITGQAIVHGNPCYIVEYHSEDDTFVSKWFFAPRRSYLELRYEQYYRGNLTSSYELDRLEQTAEGRWFPTRLTFEWTRVRDNRNSTLLMRRETHVTKFEARPAFGDNDFRLELPFGEVVRDRISGLAWYNDPWWPDLIELAREHGWPPLDFSPLAQLDCHGEKAVDGAAAPPLQVLKWVNGEEGDLGRFRGKIVVLHFFGGRLIWPEPEQLAALRGLRNVWHSAGLEVVAVATAASNPDDVQQLAKELHLDFPVAVDSPDEKGDGKTFEAYGLTTYTGTFVIDAGGVAHRARGNSLVRDVARFLEDAGATDLPALSTDFVYLPGETMNKLGAAWETAVRKGPFNGTISGKVTDGRRAVPRTTVTAHLRLTMLASTSPGAFAIHHFRDGNFSTVADDYGEFELTGLPKGTYEVTYMADDKALVAEQVTIDPSFARVRRNVALEQADGIDGRVLDASGAAVAGAVVKVRLRHPYFWVPENSTTAGLPDDPAVTDAEGRFRFKRLHVGGFTFDVTADGYKTETLENVAAGTRGMEIRLQPRVTTSK